MNLELPIFIANDHAGFHLKTFLKKERSDLSLEDLGSFDDKKIDYPVMAKKLCEKMKSDKFKFGILICGSGQGMAIKSNRYSHIRAALCSDVEQAKLARSHNDANVLCLGARLTSPSKALQILNIFLITNFDKKHPSHSKRIKML